MAYGGYADKINSSKTELDTLASAIKAIDFASSWSGPAFDKQNSSMELVLKGLNEQCGYLSNLASALSLIDEYVLRIYIPTVIKHRFIHFISMHTITI